MTNIQDKRGNVIVSAGLKVRHKSSQFEYTVDSVKKDTAGTIYVLLKKPEEPRFEPNKQAASRPTQGKQFAKNAQYNADAIDDFSTAYYTPDDESSDDLIAVEQDEFEKEYETR